MLIPSRHSVTRGAKRRRGLFSLLFCCLLLSACSRKPDDQLIVQEVQARFFQDTTLKARDIHVACADGSVTLTGEVNQESEKLAAGHLAGQVPGVKQVVISLNVVTVATATGSNSTPPQTPAPAPPSAPAATSVPVATRGNSTAPRTPPSAPSPVTTATSGSQGTTSPAPVAKTWNDPIDQYLARKPSPKTPSPLTGRARSWSHTTTTRLLRRPWTIPHVRPPARPTRTGRAPRP